MTEDYTLYAWKISSFSGKARSYLKYKRAPFHEAAPNLFDLYGAIRRRVGDVVMPVVVTPEGEWLQDTSAIIDTLEQRLSGPPIAPEGAVARFAALLLEMWGDEFWVPMQMHTRWTHPENFPRFQRGAGSALLPGFPRWLQDSVAAIPAGAMRELLPRLGVIPEQAAMLDAWLNSQLDALNAHFGTSAFLLGSRPTLGDFGLIVPLYGHMATDRWSAQNLIAPRPHLSNWVARMESPEPAPRGAIDGSDVPTSLTPILRSVFDEMGPYIEANLAQLQLAEPLGDGSFPRFLGEVEHPFGNGQFRRLAMPYILWMAQRALDALHEMQDEDAAEVRAWLKRTGGERLLALNIPRLRRVGLRVGLER